MYALVVLQFHAHWLLCYMLDAFCEARAVTNMTSPSGDMTGLAVHLRHKVQRLFLDAQSGQR